MSTVEHAQRHIDRLIRTVERDLSSRLLMIDKVKALLGAVKLATLTMKLVEQISPADLLNSKWDEQAKALQQLATRLDRMIRGTAIPIEDHERV